MIVINKSMDKRKQEKFDKPKGILMPLLMYRWRIMFPNLSAEDGNMLSSAAVKLAIDYAASELRITVRQDLYSMTFHTIFSRMMEMHEVMGTKEFVAPLGSSQTILIEHLDGSNDKATATLELDCAPKSHNFELDYTDGDNVAEHQLVFTIKTVKEYDNIEIAEKEQEHAE